jgi:hypothetical protein
MDMFPKIRDIRRPYSVRSAWIGSMRDALHAGIKQASTATAISIAAALANAAGSSGWVP